MFGAKMRFFFLMAKKNDLFFQKKCKQTLLKRERILKSGDFYQFIRKIAVPSQLKTKTNQ